MNVEIQTINGHSRLKAESHGDGRSDRAKLAVQLIANIEVLKRGNGFDALQARDSLVSVIVPSYTHEEFVTQAIESITRQTYRDIEVILIDDQSPDHTFERALAVLESSDIPYCAIRTIHAGMDANLNAGVMLANGAWIAMLASDDYFALNCIETLSAAARQANADVAVGPVDDVTRDGKFKASRADAVARYGRLSGEDLRRALLTEHGSLLVQGMLIARHVFSKVGLFTPELVASDFDFLIRMAAHHVRFAFVTEVPVYHRQTRTELCSKHIRRSVESHLAIAQRHARSRAEYRLAASTVAAEGALNALHFRHWSLAASLLLRAWIESPLATSKFLGKRLGRRLSR
jgi:GT2 family glycosyltransferase